MTYGFAGSTLVDELNRLANGGAEYPARDTYQDAQGAANKWAGTTGLGLNGALILGFPFRCSALKRFRVLARPAGCLFASCRLTGRLQCQLWIDQSSFHCLTYRSDCQNLPLSNLYIVVVSLP